MFFFSSPFKDHQRTCRSNLVCFEDIFAQLHIHGSARLLPNCPATTHVHLRFATTSLSAAAGVVTSSLYHSCFFFKLTLCIFRTLLTPCECGQSMVDFQWTCFFCAVKDRNDKLIELCLVFGILNCNIIKRLSSWKTPEQQTVHFTGFPRKF